jgi:N-carbamoyl-L-amino-acid hydrolase
MPVATNVLEINAERLWDSLERSAEIGRFRDVGLRRLALSSEDKEMRDLFVSWVRDAGCTVEVDRLGNIFARRTGSDPSLPPVAIGSHLDTQICGGRYDGILGVLCGLEVVRTLNDRGLATKRGIEVICWTNEEGARFSPPMMGSMAFAKVLSIDTVLSTVDDSGVTVSQALDAIGYAGPAPLGDRKSVV